MEREKCKENNHNKRNHQDFLFPQAGASEVWWGLFSYSSAGLQKNVPKQSRPPVAFVTGL